MHNEPVDYTGILEGHADADQYTAGEEENKLVQDINLRFDEAHQSRRDLELDWELNRGYLEGHYTFARHVIYNEVLRVYNRKSKNKYNSQENILRPIYWAHVGKRTRIIPTFEVKPANSDDSDMRGAQASTACLKYLKQSLDLDSVYLKAHRFLPWAGTAFIRVEWDKSAGMVKAQCNQCKAYDGAEEEVGDPCPQCQLMAESQAEDQFALQRQQWEQAVVMSAKAGRPFDAAAPQKPEIPEAPPLTRVREGDIRAYVVDSRHCYPSPGDGVTGQWRYFITRVPMPVTEIRKRWPQKGRYVSEESGIYAERTLLYAGSRHSSSVNTAWLANHVYLYEYHEGPSAQFPNGRLIRMANNIILEEIAPHPEFKIVKRLPFYCFFDEILDDIFWGHARISQCRPAIDERNRLLSQGRAHRELTNRPWMIKGQRTKMAVDEVDETPGRILSVDYTHGPKPEFLKIPPMANYYQEELVRQEEFVRKIFQVTAQEMGQSPTDQSGRHAAIIEAQASESIRPHVVDNALEWKHLHIGMLQLLIFYYHPDRTWTVQGKDSVRTYRTYAVNLSPGWDLTLEQTDTLSSSPPIRINQVIEINERTGYFNDVNTGQLDRRRFAAAAGLTEPGVSPDVTAQEHLYFSQVPEMIQRGEFVGPQHWDSPEIAVEELVTWLRGPGRTLMRTRPDVVQYVGQLYWYYFQLVRMQTMADVQTYPSGQPQQQQQGQQQQGGQVTGGQNAGAVGGQGGQPAGSVAQEAGQQMGAADAAGERAARTQSKHES